MPNLNVGLPAAIAETTICMVMDTYFGKCPSGKEFNNWADDVNPDCICNNATPPVCRVTNAFLHSCPINAKTCNCNTVASAPSTNLRDPVTGKDLSSSNPGGCTAWPCTACDGNDGVWRSNGTGYEVKRTGGTCSGNSCTSNGTCSGATVEYRCAAGYCGTTTDGKTGCAKIENMSINQCFMITQGLDTGPAGALRCACDRPTVPALKKCFGAYNYYPGLSSNVTEIYCAAYVPYTTGYERGNGFIVGADGMCAIKSELFRCAAGFYGQPKDTASGCSQCPTPGTSDAGSTAISQCYIDSGTDDTGVYNFGGAKCYY